VLPRALDIFTVSTCTERPWDGTKGGLQMAGQDVWMVVVAGSTTLSKVNGLPPIQLSSSMSAKTHHGLQKAREQKNIDQG
jgi:hypothetical protein